MELLQSCANKPLIFCCRLATSRERIDIQKQLREQRRAAGPKTEMKTLRLKSKISTHDLEIKVKHMKEFIQKGHSVRVIVQNNSSDSKVCFWGEIRSNIYIQWMPQYKLACMEDDIWK